jgi:hypothetical protein
VEDGVVVSPGFSTFGGVGCGLIEGDVVSAGLEAVVVLVSELGLGSLPEAGGVLAVLVLNFFLLFEGFFAMLLSFLRSRSRGRFTPGPINWTHQD